MLLTYRKDPKKENMEYQKQSTGSLAGFQMTKLFGGFQNLVSGELDPWIQLDQIPED